MKNPPPIEQLTHIAASLSPQSNAGDFKSLARRALELWTACGVELDREARVAVLSSELTEELGRSEDSIPKPPRGFPANLRDFMKVFIHLGDETKNMPVFRSFLAEWLHHQKAYNENTSLKNTSPPADGEMERVIFQLRETGFDEAAWVFYGRQLLVFRKGQRSEHAAIAAKFPRPNRKTRKKGS